jgi:hypothetical protein
MRGHAGIRDALVVDHVLDDLLFVELRERAVPPRRAQLRPGDRRSERACGDLRNGVEKS